MTPLYLLASVVASVPWAFLASLFFKAKRSVLFGLLAVQVVGMAALLMMVC